MGQTSVISAIPDTAHVDHGQPIETSSELELQSDWEDDDIATRNNGDLSNGNYQQIQQEMIRYKKAYQAEQIKNQRLQQQLQQNSQMYSSQINSLKQDNQMQQYIMQQQLQQQQMQQSIDQSTTTTNGISTICSI